MPKVRFTLGQCITDQVFKLAYDVKDRFVENKSGIWLANLTAAQDCLLFDTSSKHPTTAIDLVFFYRPSFKTWRKIGNALFFYKISIIEHNKVILILILMISVDYDKIQVFCYIYW